MSLSDTLKELRHRHRMTQEAVAAALGTSKQTIHKYENGIVTNIPLEKISKLATLFGVSASFLINQEDFLCQDNVPGTQADFHMQAKDNSMIGARILEGDTVFIKTQNDVKSGEIAVVKLGDETLIRRVFYGIEHQSILLYPENALYSPMRFERPEDIRVIGKVLCGRYEVK